MFALGVGAHWLLGRGVYGGAAAAAGTSSDVLDLGKVSRLFAEHGFVVIRGEGDKRLPPCRSAL